MDRLSVEDKVDGLYARVLVHPLKSAFKHPLTELSHYLQLLGLAVAQTAHPYAASPVN